LAIGDDTMALDREEARIEAELNMVYKEEEKRKKDLIKIQDMLRAGKIEEAQEIATDLIKESDDIMHELALIKKETFHEVAELYERIHELKEKIRER
jgi:hypothetical protein